MGVFRDRSRLSPSYLPPRLRHRDEELSRLIGVFSGFESSGVAYPQRIQIVGGVGLGKTVLCLKAGEELERRAKERKAKFQHIYVNLKVHSGSKVVLYRHMARMLSPDLASPSLSAEELLHNMLNYLTQNKIFALFSFDEIDYYVKKYGADVGTVIYDFTRLTEVSGGRDVNVVGLVITARSTDYQRLLDPAERSSLGRLSIMLKPYSSEQLVDILSDRVEAAFVKGVVDDEVVEYVAEITAAPPIDGDVRYALDVLLFAGNLAENRGESKVTAEHVREVVSQLNPKITSEDLMNLSEEAKLVLLALARALKTKRTPYVKLREVREMCEIVCEEKSHPYIRDFEEHLQDLADRGIVEIRSLTKIGIVGTPAEKLDAFLSSIIERLG